MHGVGIKSKNERIDAKGLVRMGAESHLDPREHISKDLYVLIPRSLTRHLGHLPPPQDGLPSNQSPEALFSVTQV